jgi:phytoene synthase
MDGQRSAEVSNLNIALRDSFAFCTALARKRAGNFYYAFLLLPRAERQAMCALYAFLRVADDLVDEPGDAGRQCVDLQQWRAGLAAALQGEPSHPIHPALVDTVTRFDVNPDHLHGLLDGVQQDLVQHSFTTFDELYRYCYRVASLVGLCCIRIWGCRDHRADAWAVAAGIAFQLTNILRDAALDCRAGRVYLPQEDLARFHCRAEQLSSGPCDEHYAALMEFQVHRAREYYDLAAPLMGCLPGPGRAVLQVMTRTYRGLLDEIARRGFTRIHETARLSRWRKLGIFLRALPVRYGWGSNRRT